MRGTSASVVSSASPMVALRLSTMRSSQPPAASTPPLLRTDQSTVIDSPPRPVSGALNDSTTRSAYGLASATTSIVAPLLLSAAAPPASYSRNTP